MVSYKRWIFGNTINCEVRQFSSFKYPKAFIYYVRCLFMATCTRFTSNHNLHAKMLMNRTRCVDVAIWKINSFLPAYIHIHMIAKLSIIIDKIILLLHR